MHVEINKIHILVMTMLFRGVPKWTNCRRDFFNYFQACWIVLQFEEILLISKIFRCCCKIILELKLDFLWI